MKPTDLDALEWLQREERERVSRDPPTRRPLPGPPAIDWTELPEDTTGGRIAREWNFYRREVGRLLAEGHEGRWVLIKEEAIIGIWDTEHEADQVRVQRFLMQDVLIHQVLSREPVLRGPTWFRRCRD